MVGHEWLINAKHKPKLSTHYGNTAADAKPLSQNPATGNRTRATRTAINSARVNAMNK